MTDTKSSRVLHKRVRAAAVVRDDVLLDLPELQFSESDLVSVRQFEAGENYAWILYSLACRCVADSDTRTILEIGTGGSSIAFAKALNRSKSEGQVSKLYSVDLDANKPTTHDVGVVGGLGVDWEVVRGDSLKVPMDELPLVVDMLFIDGDHGGDHAIGDYRRYAPLVRKGGLIVYDDYPLFSGPAAAVVELEKEGVTGSKLTYNMKDGNSFYVIQKV